MDSADPMNHDEARELLPWLVNDTLHGEERERVQLHASSCVICRRELADLERIQASVREEMDSAPLRVPDMRRVNARIDAMIEKQNNRKRILAVLRNAVDHPWRIAFAAQSFLLVILLSFLLWPKPETAGFTTLTDPASPPAGDYLRVVFDPDMDESEITRILDELSLELVDGPSARGVATLGYTMSGNAGPDAAAAKLLEKPGVLFAEPVRTRTP